MSEHSNVTGACVAACGPGSSTELCNCCGTSASPQPYKDRACSKNFACTMQSERRPSTGTHALPASVCCAGVKGSSRSHALHFRRPRPSPTQRTIFIHVVDHTTALPPCWPGGFSCCLCMNLYPQTSSILAELIIVSAHPITSL